MNETITIILELSCIIPAIISILYIKKIDEKYFPFIYTNWLCVFTEIINVHFFYINKNEKLGFLNINVFYLVNYLLLIYFFYVQNIIKSKNIFYVYAFTGVALMIANFIYVKYYIGKDLLESSIVHSLIFFILAVGLLNTQLFQFKINFFKNPKALIAIGIIIYYVDYILISSVQLLKLDTNFFYNKIFPIHQIINAFTYLIFAWAILCIPKTKKYLQ